MPAQERAQATMTTSNTNTVPRSESECWINTAAACKHLAISAPTIRRWIKAGRLKPKRTPTGELRFRRSELDSLLA
jgi:excisionase family DNA binding protein